MQSKPSEISETLQNGNLIFHIAIVTIFLLRSGLPVRVPLYLLRVVIKWCTKLLLPLGLKTMACSGLSLSWNERLSTFNFAVLSSHVELVGMSCSIIIVSRVAGGNTPSCCSLKRGWLHHLRSSWHVITLDMLVMIIWHFFLIGEKRYKPEQVLKYYGGKKKNHKRNRILSSHFLLMVILPLQWVTKMVRAVLIWK